MWNLLTMEDDEKGSEELEKRFTVTKLLENCSIYNDTYQEKFEEI